MWLIWVVGRQLVSTQQRLTSSEQTSPSSKHLIPLFVTACSDFLEFKCYAYNTHICLGIDIIASCNLLRETAYSTLKKLHNISLNSTDVIL